ncbi:hypothetical protein [Streptomyces niveus]|uniref:hypothetical protein n=1 Tax=Streptomyces niveus TaxID=193462 RepID=UPI00084C60B0|nr:hypothetical protein [Streptomyces niveus]
MEQSGTSPRLAGVVHDLASEVVSVLRDGGHSSVVGGTVGTLADDQLGLAAVRVLGADVLLPSVLTRRRPLPDDLAVFQRAVLTFAPGATSSETTVWSHWGMTQTLHRLDAPATGPGAGPDASWLEALEWPKLTHQLSILAALAVPGADSAVAQVAADRPVDVARGFVRAVRRRDWLQAAGAGRWLSVIDGVPETLGLDTGLEFVAQMAGADARVGLHVHAAQHIRAESAVNAVSAGGRG